MRVMWTVAFVCMWALVGCSAPAQPLQTRQITIEGQPYTVEVAHTQSQRARGLMGRPQLAPGAGMLFVWDHNAPRSFWMKNTLIPLDILYFQQTQHDIVLVSWLTAVPCTQDPCPSYPSTAPAQYVVELPAGTVMRQGWTQGARLRLL